MKVLITGASGFIGINLQEYFIRHCVQFETLSIRLGDEFSINDDITAVIHLAGKAHDLNNAVDENEYYRVNTDLTKEIYLEFCKSKAKVFIYISSVKAVEDNPSNIIDEKTLPRPKTPYGKSKLAAEEYLAKNRISDKSLFILRPCMVHGPNNKGNLNVLYKFVNKGIPYPFGCFSNLRSYLSVDNLCFIIKELIINDKISSGIYMVSDDDEISTNDVVKLIGETLNRNIKILNLPKFFVFFLVRFGDLFSLQLNSVNLQKLTGSYIVSNEKIKAALGKQFPVNTKTGLIKTFESFLKIKQ
ncbi:NAD-dependent epimerase/dehydratase family protein [Lacihabitans sp. LS3-19]|uniref:NAD-dependent epimerase/dehydratase family protein n=1 Tax=Lacihabitans sp. LS3-19 TaxID=2487335 RepID=UPI0020CE04BA|nr:NAD-dependent epimerase/dehydratase family protein [Lacihabitans sp. LS3-19]MCP9769396.1 NAD-dependent epimerase/dehydratase family protein [Lacihabitans sp. LS3-19]